MKALELIDKIYFKVSFLKIMLLRKILRFLLRKIVLTYWRCVCFLTRPSIDRKKSDIIVSLTSFPNRIKQIHLVCNSLLRQTLPPKAVYLWLSKDQFSDINMLPSQLLMLRKYGLNIRFVDGDLRSHKKYYYILKEFPQDTIVLADDDIIYNPSLIETLVTESRIRPNAIIAQYARKIKYIGNNKLASYKLWKKLYDLEGPVFFGSGGGTLIPPNAFYHDVLDINLFQKLTPTADDVWLNAMARLKGTLICKSKLNSALITIDYKNNRTLSSVNNNNCVFVNNDSQIKNVINYYNTNMFAKK